MARLPPGARTVRESSTHHSGRRVHWKGDFANVPKSGIVEHTENGYARIRWDDGTSSMVPEAIFKTPRWELHETGAEEGSSLYDKLKSAGQELDHHESDLYVKWTPEADAIIKAHGGPEAANARSFKNNKDGKRWIDIPFAYAPWWEKRQRRHTVREDRSERKFSMTYGELPPFEQFERDVHTRPDPEHDGQPYWPAGTLYPMELVSSHEIELAETFGLEEFEAERQITGRNTRVRGFKDNERAIYEFIEFLIDRWNNSDEEAGDLASSIMYTLGYEWI